MPHDMLRITRTFLIFVGVATAELDRSQNEEKDPAADLPNIHEMVPRHDWRSPEARDRLQNQLPVVLTGTGFVDPVLGKWTDDYLVKAWTSKKPVFSQLTNMKTVDGRHMFYSTATEPALNPGDFQPEPEVANGSYLPRHTTTMQEYLKTQPERLLNGTGQYVRELLTKKLINPMPPKPNKWGKKITDDVSSFDWALPKWLQKEFGWWTEDDGSLSKELTWMGGVMWMGDRGYISTLHHDWVHQILTQISGEKRLYMYPPSFNCYPMPTVHPQTRVTRIYDIRNVDPSFHRFHSHPGMLAHMKPGDSLYIPFMWFHYVEHVRHTPRPISFSISYKPAHIHDPQFDFHNGYKVVDQHDKSRRRFYAEYGIVEHVISVFGAKQGVNYLRLMGKAAFTSSGPHPSSDMVEIHQEIFPQIIEQIDMMGLLRENETAMDYMIRITGEGRFEIPTFHDLSPAQKENTKKKKMKKKKKKKKKKGSGKRGGKDEF